MASRTGGTESADSQMRVDRDPRTGPAAGRVTLQLRIVAVISDARREHRLGGCLADCNAIGDGFRAYGNAGDRRVIRTLDRVGLRRELVQGDDISRTDGCRF